MYGGSEAKVKNSKTKRNYLSLSTLTVGFHQSKLQEARAKLGKVTLISVKVLKCRVNVLTRKLHELELTL